MFGQAGTPDLMNIALAAYQDPAAAAAVLGQTGLTPPTARGNLPAAGVNQVGLASPSLGASLAGPVAPPAPAAGGGTAQNPNAQLAQGLAGMRGVVAPPQPTPIMSGGVHGAAKPEGVSNAALQGLGQNTGAQQLMALLMGKNQPQVANLGSLLKGI